MKTHFKTSKLCLTALTAMTLAFSSGGSYSASYAANPRSQDPISCSDPKTQFPTLPPCYRPNSDRANGLTQKTMGLVGINYGSDYVSSYVSNYALNDGHPNYAIQSGSQFEASVSMTNVQ